MKPLSTKIILQNFTHVALIWRKVTNHLAFQKHEEPSERGEIFTFESVRLFPDLLLAFLQTLCFKSPPFCFSSADAVLPRKTTGSLIWRANNRFCPSLMVRFAQELLYCNGWTPKINLHFFVYQNKYAKRKNNNKMRKWFWFLINRKDNKGRGVQWHLNLDSEQNILNIKLDSRNFVHKPRKKRKKFKGSDTFWN